jgi:hypothetical protein
MADEAHREASALMREHLVGEARQPRRISVQARAPRPSPEAASGEPELGRSGKAPPRQDHLGPACRPPSRPAAGVRAERFSAAETVLYRRLVEDQLNPAATGARGVPRRLHDPCGGKRCGPVEPPECCVYSQDRQSPSGDFGRVTELS